MKKYSFKLEGLLKLRKFKETKIKTELGLIVKEMELVKKKIKDLKSDVRDAYRGQESVLKSSSKGDLLKFFPQYITTRKKVLDNIKEELLQLEKAYDDKVLEMKAAMGDTKVINNLKDKDKAIYKKEKNKKEFENIEDIRILRSGAN